MKWNWGYGIAALYIGFVAMMISLVALSMGRKVDLVTDKYYDEEVKFEDKLANIKRSQTLATPVRWQVNEEDIVITFPKEVGQVSGQVQLYCPSNSEKDRVFALNNLEENTIHISRKEVPTGRYHLQIDWAAAGQGYWDEGVISLNEQ